MSNRVRRWGPPVLLISPTLILLGVFVYGERFTAVDAVAFGAIWTALALYSGDVFAASRARKD